MYGALYMFFQKENCTNKKLSLLKKCLCWSAIPGVLCVIFIYICFAKENPSNWKEATLYSYSYYVYDPKGSKANALVITNRNGEVFRYDKRYHVSQQVLHYYLGNTSELSILYSTYRGTNFIESMICDGTVLIDIQENIDYYYSELKSTAAVGGIFGFLAIIAAVIPVILIIKKKK